MVTIAFISFMTSIISLVLKMFFESKAKPSNRRPDGVIEALFSFMFRTFYLLLFSFVPLYEGTTRYRRVSNVFLVIFYITLVSTLWAVHNLKSNRH